MGLAVLALASSAALCSYNSISENVQPGDLIEKTFSMPPADSFGVKSFAALRGKPVLVEFWGTR